MDTTPIVRNIRHYFWDRSGNYVMIQANVVRSRLKLSGHKGYYDELQMTKEQADTAITKHRMFLDSVDRDEIRQNSTQVFYVPSKR